MNTFDPKIDLEYLLNKVPLFSSVSKNQLNQLASCFLFVEYKKNDLIFKEGDPGDAMYIIRSGGVSVYTSAGEKPVAELKRGDFFGEMALLSNSPRNATITANLTTTLFKLKKKDFLGLVSKNKEIGLFLSRLYARRLSPEHEATTSGKKAVLYSVSASGPDLGFYNFLYSLSYHISTESKKKVLVIEPGLELDQVIKKYDLEPMTCPDNSLFKLLPPPLYQPHYFNCFFHPSGFVVLQISKDFGSKLISALSLLMDSFNSRYDIILFSLSHCFEELEQQIVKLCDKNLLLINNTPEAQNDVKTRLKELEENTDQGLDKIRVGVSHTCGFTGIARGSLKKELNLSEIPSIWVERNDKALNDEIDTQKLFPVTGARAVAREIAGVRIGLALGAGAARGWCHIGVLNVLKKHNIHIDMIAGTSMGALVGAIFSATGSVRHLKQNTIDLFPTRGKARRKIFDYTFPLKGFIRGKKVMNLVSSAVNNADFMDLLIPTFLVSVDIFKGEEVLFETGDVTTAVRSSLSLPVVFSPVRHEGRWLVDGGLLNPVPVDILEQKGADKIISVCVEYPNSSMNHNTTPPGIMEIISRTMHIVHQKVTSGFAQKSDIVIYPDVQDFAWNDFHMGESLMQRGEDACTQVISEIKQLVQ